MNAVETTGLLPSDAVVLASSSRSGSTWLADMLGYALHRQQVFEPLHPHYSATVRQLTGLDATDHLASYYLPADATAPAWQAFFDDLLCGRLHTDWTDQVPVLAEPMGYLVKMIRGNLLLGYLLDHHQPTLIFLVRHPCAVVHSRLRLGWQLDVQTFLRQEALVETYLRPWLQQIEAVTDPIQLHAIWWAIENRVAMCELGSRPHQLAFYEHVMLQPAHEVARLTQAMTQPKQPVPAPLIERFSRTTFRKDADNPLISLVDWKAEFSDDQQANILLWAHRFGLDWYDTDLAPVNPAEMMTP